MPKAMTSATGLRSTRFTSRAKMAKITPRYVRIRFSICARLRLSLPVC